MDLFVIVLFIGGVFTGLYAGSAGGASLVTFPLLILSGLSTQTAIATNRLSMVLLEFSSAVKFSKEKKLDLKIGVLLGLVAAIGSFIGSNLVMRVDEKLLNLIVAAALIFIFVILYNKSKIGIRKSKRRTSWFTTAVLILLLGVYGGFFGAGFGTFVMFLLVLTGLTFVKSAAIGRVIGLIMSSTAAVIFALNGVINYTYALSLGFGCAIGSWAGISLALKKGDKYVKTLFIIIILATTAKLVYDFLY